MAAMMGGTALPTIPFSGTTQTAAVTRTGNLQNGINGLANALAAPFSSMNQFVSLNRDVPNPFDSSGRVRGQLENFPSTMQGSQRKSEDILRTHRSVLYPPDGTANGMHLQQEDLCFSCLPTDLENSNMPEAETTMQMIQLGGENIEQVVTDRVPVQMYNLAQVNAQFLIEQCSQLLEAISLPDKFPNLHTENPSHPLERKVRSLTVLRSADYQWDRCKYMFDGVFDNIEDHGSQYMVGDSKQGGFQFMHNTFAAEVSAGSGLFLAVVPVRYRCLGDIQTSTATIGPDQESLRSIQSYLQEMGLEVISADSHIRNRLQTNELDNFTIGMRFKENPQVRESGRSYGAPSQILGPGQFLPVQLIHAQTLEKYYGKSFYVYHMIMFAQPNCTDLPSPKALAFLSDGTGGDNLTKYFGHDCVLQMIGRMKHAKIDKRFFSNLFGYDSTVEKAALANPKDKYKDVHLGMDLLMRVEIAMDYPRMRKATDKQFEVYLCKKPPVSFLPINNHRVDLVAADKVWQKFEAERRARNDPFEFGTTQQASAALIAKSDAEEKRLPYFSMPGFEEYEREFRGTPEPTE